MTIRKRLVFTLGVALLALLVVGGFGLWRLSQAQQRFELVQTNIIPSTKELNDAKDNVSNLRRLAYGYLVSADPATRASTEQEIAAMDKSVDQHLATYERSDIADDTDLKFLQAEKAAFAAYRSIRQGFFDKVKAGDQDGAKSMLANGGTQYNAAKTLKATSTTRNSAAIYATRTTPPAQTLSG
jgi:CHASE3 domain sensor protein